MLSLSLTVLMLLLVLSLVRSWNPLIRPLTYFTVAIWLLVYSGFLPSLLLKPLQSHPRVTSPAWGANNMIVLLGSGATQWSDQSLSTQSLGFSRVKMAAELYHSCLRQSDPCRLITSGGDPGNWGRSEADLMFEELVRLGVNPSHVQAESKSLNTYDNARYTLDLLQDIKPEKIYLVTSGTHMNRALMLFRYFQQTAPFEMVAAPADYFRPGFQWRGFALNAYFCDLALHEYAGFTQFYVYKWLGLR